MQNNDLERTAPIKSTGEYMTGIALVLTSIFAVIFVLARFFW